MPVAEQELDRLKRWRLILGGDQADGIGVQLGTEQLEIDRALEALYDPNSKGGLSSPDQTRHGGRWATG